MDKSKVSIGEKPVVTIDVVDGKIRLIWKTSLLTRILDYDIQKCVGCSLCLPCPWDAITLGPVQEAAAGRIEGAPLVHVDPELCAFCGLCDSACIFGAFRASFEGESAINEFGRIEGDHQIDHEKCAPCLLCVKVCPTGSLEVEVHVEKKQDLVKYPGEKFAEGDIQIDEDKCSYCGLCELLCPEAIKIFWSESAEPPDFRPAVGIRVNKDNCDYCGLCAKICPDDAITVECYKAAPREIREPIISGELKHNDLTCVKCGLCAKVCPFDALTVTKPFSGEVEIVKLEKCDPVGCHNCFNICPVKAIYPTGTNEKIAVLDDHCVYCGACENSCPHEVLKARRDGFNIKQLEEAREWERGRKIFFDAVVGKEPPPSGLFERDISIEPIERPVLDLQNEKGWSKINGERKLAMKLVGETKEFLKQEKRYHLQIERGRIERVVKALKKFKIIQEEE